MIEFSWCDVVEAVDKYAGSMAEFRTICDELEFGSATVEDYPGLYDLLVENLKNK